MAVKIIFWNPTLSPTRKDFFFLFPCFLLSVFLNFMSEGSSRSISGVRDSCPCVRFILPNFCIFFCEFCVGGCVVELELQFDD
jgi:hypothetical protein